MQSTCLVFSGVVSSFVVQVFDELIQSLRATLQTIDGDFPSLADQPVVAEVKRLLLLRLSEFESAEERKIKFNRRA